MTGPRLDVDWLHDADLQRILSVLSADGEQARIVGGAVRNTLMGRPVADIDIATTCLPRETMRRLGAAGIRAVDTGMAHGTLTAIVDGRGFEITTLREDVETDGRRAVVRFGRSWEHDAQRRDFTINALYAEPDGTIVDLVDGRADIEKAVVRFIGDPQDRIREDYLRILRFFRFFAWYGKGRPDAEGLKACARLKDGMKGLSVERVWAEMRRLLAAADPSRALLWMRQTGVLTLLLPESEKWGIEGIHGLMAAERAHGWPADAVLRLMVIIPPRTDVADGLARRWKLPNAVRARLVATGEAVLPAADIERSAFDRLLYRGDRAAIVDGLRLEIARRGAGAPGAAALAALLDRAEGWRRPRFPLSGRDLIAAGFAPGPSLGEALQGLEEKWIESGFALDRRALIALAAQPHRP